MFEQPVPGGVVRSEPAVHTDRDRSRETVRIYTEAMTGVEHGEPGRVCDPPAPRGSGIDRERTGRSAEQAVSEQIDSEMTIAWGADPGWTRPQVAEKPVGKGASDHARDRGTQAR